MHGIIANLAREGTTAQTVNFFFNHFHKFIFQTMCKSIHLKNAQKSRAVAQLGYASGFYPWFALGPRIEPRVIVLGLPHLESLLAFKNRECIKGALFDHHAIF